MNEITIRPELTWREFNVLRYGKVGPIAFWALLTIGAACLATSAAMTWATTASILAGLALAAFIFILLLTGLFNVRGNRRTYERFGESNITYVFTNERILTTWRYGQSSLAWQAIDRLTETKTLYLLASGNRYVFYVPKRNIQPHNVGEFIHLLRTHGLLKGK